MAGLEKAHTRELAKEWGLPVFNKPESQDICFIPDNDYKGFLQHERKGIFKPGDFVDQSGRVIGRHKGIAAYTIGQRRGLNLGGPGGPYYVTARRRQPAGRIRRCPARRHGRSGPGTLRRRNR